MFFDNKILYSMQQLAPYIKQSIAEGMQVRLTVTGSSMYPLFRNRRDTVLLDNPNSIKKYDIVFYQRSNGQYILHRVLKVHGEWLIIAGDNEVQKEYCINKNQVFAKVVKFSRNNKEYSCNELWYKIYSRLWCCLFPFRHLIILLWVKFRRLTNGKNSKK